MINYEVNNVKEIYESNSIVSYYDEITDRIGLLNSEKICFIEYINFSDRILDIGCGAGRTTIGLRDIGFDNIVGVDISTEMISKARKRDKSINFLVSNVLTLPFEDNSFDTAFFSFNGLMLIPHLANRIIAIKEIKRILKKGGIFIFSTPFLDNKLDTQFWKHRFEKYSGDLDEIEIGDIFVDDIGVREIYIHIPFIDEIETMLNDADFTIMSCKVRRDIYTESDNIENELDDNLYWIVRSE